MSSAPVYERTKIPFEAMIRVTLHHFIRGHQFLKDRLLAFYSQSAIGV